MTSKREFYAGIVRKQRDTRHLAMALCRLAAAAEVSKKDTGKGGEQMQKALRSLIAIARDKATHLSAARAANRELVRNARVLKRLPDEPAQK